MRREHAGQGGRRGQDPRDARYARAGAALTLLLAGLLGLTACGDSADDAPAPTTTGDPAAISMRPVLAVRSGGTVQGVPTPAVTTPPTDASDPAWITPAQVARLRDVDCSLAGSTTTGTATTGSATTSTATTSPDVTVGPGRTDPGHPIVACGGAEAYLLGPAELDGSDVATATATPEVDATGSVSSPAWMVVLTLTPAGRQDFAAVTERLAAQPEPRSQLAIVVGGVVLSAPSVRESISGGVVQLTGNFSQAQAVELARRLTPR